MSPRDVRSALLSAPVPDELEAQRRTWGVVKTAYAEREPVRRPRRLRLLVALAVLAALPPDHRAVIVLRHLLEYTPGEIAELLGLPRGTVNSRLRRGLDSLRETV